MLELQDLAGKSNEALEALKQRVLTIGKQAEASGGQIYATCRQNSIELFADGRSDILPRLVELYKKCKSLYETANKILAQRKSEGLEPQQAVQAIPQVVDVVPINSAQPYPQAVDSAIAPPGAAKAHVIDHDARVPQEAVQRPAVFIAAHSAAAVPEVKQSTEQGAPAALIQEIQATSIDQAQQTPSAAAQRSSEATEIIAKPEDVGVPGKAAASCTPLSKTHEKLSARQRPSHCTRKNTDGAEPKAAPVLYHDILEYYRPVIPRHQQTYESKPCKVSQSVMPEAVVNRKAVTNKMQAFVDRVYCLDTHQAALNRLSSFLNVISNWLVGGTGLAAGAWGALHVQRLFCQTDCGPACRASIVPLAGASLLVGLVYYVTKKQINPFLIKQCVQRKTYLLAHDNRQVHYSMQELSKMIIDANHKRFASSILIETISQRTPLLTHEASAHLSVCKAMLT